MFIYNGLKGKARQGELICIAYFKQKAIQGAMGDKEKK